MPRGRVRFFLDKKGYGFIIPEDGSEDVFIHYKNIEAEGYKTLVRDEEVEYVLQDGDRGRFAEKVISLGRHSDLCF